VKRSKNNIYSKVVIAAVLILLINQSFIQYVLYKKEKDSLIINQAGKQRMYSQKILSLYLKEPNKNNQELNEINSLWKNSHYELLDQFSGSNNIFYGNVIEKNLKELSQYLESASDIIRSDNYSYNQLFQNQNIFLEKMNDTVNLIEKNAHSKLKVIVVFELLFACFSLFLIFYEVNKIFKPIIKDLSLKNNQLKESNILLQKYAYLASHNFKTPIRTIVSYIGLFKKKYHHHMSEDDILHYSFIENATRQLIKASDDLVQYSEIYSKSAKLDSINVMDLYESIINEKQKENSDVNFEIIADAKIIKADISLLKIAISRIINNSIYYRNKEQALNVKLKHTSDGNSDILIVEDNGIGIDDTYQEKAFEIFEKLHNTSTHSGSGIGLAICKNIIDKHKGKIKMKARHSSGTKTIIELPV
jgi:signal transduction histidine kinase